jgi:hypothetical protein
VAQDHVRGCAGRRRWVRCGQQNKCARVPSVADGSSKLK